MKHLLFVLFALVSISCGSKVPVSTIPQEGSTQEVDKPFNGQIAISGGATPRSAVTAYLVGEVAKQLYQFLSLAKKSSDVGAVERYGDGIRCSVLAEHATICALTVDDDGGVHAKEYTNLPSEPAEGGVEPRNSSGDLHLRLKKQNPETAHLTVLGDAAAHLFDLMSLDQPGRTAPGEVRKGKALHCKAGAAKGQPIHYVCAFQFSKEGAVTAAELPKE